MLKEKLKQILPLLGGTGLGILLSTMFLGESKTIDFNPQYRIATDGGMIIIPGNISNKAKSVHYNIKVDGKLISETIPPLDTIFLNFEWSENLQEIELQYLNDKKEVIGVHNARIGDGLIIDDLIIISKDKKIDS